jgi:hypothetical protein
LVTEAETGSWGAVNSEKEMPHYKVSQRSPVECQSVERLRVTRTAAAGIGNSRSPLPASVTDTIDTIEKLEELAAWHRMRAEYAGSAWVWEARLLTAEDLERRAADLRAQQHRDAPRRRVRPAGRAGG